MGKIFSKNKIKIIEAGESYFFFVKKASYEAKFTYNIFVSSEEKQDCLSVLELISENHHNSILSLVSLYFEDDNFFHIVYESESKESEEIKKDKSIYKSVDSQLKEEKDNLLWKISHNYFPMKNLEGEFSFTVGCTFKINGSEKILEISGMVPEIKKIKTKI